MTKTADGVEFELGKTMLWYVAWGEKPYTCSLLVTSDDIHPWVHAQSAVGAMFSTKEAAINYAIKDTNDLELISIYKEMLNVQNSH